MNTTTIQLYKRPRNYMGPDFFDYYVGLQRTRDSKSLERANFDSFLKLLGGESESVLVIRDHHWLCGWIETIYIHKNSVDLVVKADHILTDLKDYPVVDEILWSEYENDEKCSYWDSLGLREKIQECVRAGISFFAARREHIPSEIYDMLEF